MSWNTWLPVLPILAAIGAFWGWHGFRQRQKEKQLRQLAVQGVLLDIAPVKGFHYVEGNQAILPLLRQGEPLLLRREPENPHDCKAIRLLRQDGQAIGYLPMAYNGIAAALLDQGIPLTARLDLGRPGTRRWLEVWLYWPGEGHSDFTLAKKKEQEFSPPGALGVRLMAEERLQQLCPCRPRQWGGLFLDLVLLEPEQPGKQQPALPLLDSQGEQIGWLPLCRLPLHRRRMVSGMLAKGQALFACLDQEVSLPSAGLWCAALYWKDGIQPERIKEESKH